MLQYLNGNTKISFKKESLVNLNDKITNPPQENKTGIKQKIQNILGGTGKEEIRRVLNKVDKKMEAEVHLRNGIDLLKNNGDRDKIRQEFELALRLGNARVFYHYAQMEKNGQTSQKYLTQGASRGDDLCQFELGKILFANGNYRKAEILLKKVQKQNNPEIQNQVLFFLGKIQKRRAETTKDAVEQMILPGASRVKEPSKKEKAKEFSSQFLQEKLCVKSLKKNRLLPISWL